MAAPRHTGTSLKGAYQIGGHWTWVGDRGEVHRYQVFLRLIEAAAAEGWRFDRRIGRVGIFRGG
ncbi:MAG TPA: hypothetical protein VHL09_09275 [Dehalococcoidia bacterium]|nr:hypothetical protein [Dehalococcoidia bacterium]